jgi:HSP20 family protein
MENNVNNNNNNDDILPIDLFNRLFGSGRRGGLFDTRDIFRGFDDMHKEMDRMFNDVSSKAPKDLVREYQTSDEVKVREAGPIVYGYSMTIGPDGKPHVREFGNIKVGKDIAGQYLGIQKPQISAEREPLSDITTTEKEVKVVLDMPGVMEKDVKINAYDDGKVEIKTANNSPRKHYKVVQLPKEANTETARFTYINGILEVTLDKKSDIKTKTKDAFVHLRNAFSNISSTTLDFKNKMKYVKKQD